MDKEHLMRLVIIIIIITHGMNLAFITTGKETRSMAWLSHPVFKLFIAQNASWIKKKT